VKLSLCLFLSVRWPWFACFKSRSLFTMVVVVESLSCCRYGLVAAEVALVTVVFILFSFIFYFCFRKLRMGVVLFQIL